MTPNPSLSCVDLSDVDVYSNNPVVDARYRAAVELMAAKGHPIQYKASGRWVGFVLGACQHPLCWADFPYRISPDARPKVMVPWDCLADLEKVGATHIRFSANAGWFVINSASSYGFCYMTHAGRIDVLWSQLSSDTSKPHYQWSSDLKTWHPCTKERVG
jgi:hypothetical protein